MGARVVMWDFDGTLASRPGLWSGCILEVLDEQEPAHTGSVEQVRAAMSGRYPWSRHEQPHPHLADPEDWWRELTAPLAAAIEGCGVASARALALAQEVRLRFVDGSRGWRLFEDSAAALELTRSRGWRNVILSNHVPELEALVEALGLSSLVERVFTSARIGYEKPHPEAFRIALAACGEPSERWMVGDNPGADVAGARAVGVDALLVRSGTEGDPARPGRARDALAAARVIVGGWKGAAAGP